MKLIYQICIDCDTPKPLEDYNKDPKRTLGVQSHCKECHKIRGKSYYIANAEKRKQYTRDWKKDNPGHSAAYSKEHPEKNRANSRKTKAKKKAQRAGANWQYFDPRSIWTPGSSCGLCGMPVRWEDFEADHIIPTSLGGAHSPTNLHVVHRTGNRRKGTKTLTEYREYLKEVGLSPEEGCGLQANK